MKNEQNLKQIPYGISNFDRFWEKNLYYVDKTMYIKSIEEKGDFLFFIRPRRFGKSLFLSILESYYDIAQKDRFDSIFFGTYIQQNPTKEKNKYLVLKLNFSMVDPNISKTEESFLSHIRDAANFFVKKYGKSLGVDIKTAIKEFSSVTSATTLMATFLNYFKEKEQQLYVIIDEYDNFANTILSTIGELEYQKMTHDDGFLRSFFNVIKGGTTGSGAPISRLFMMGVSPITLDDVTSGFNIAQSISLDSDINEMLGFTRNEVEAMIEYYRQTGKIRHSTPELLELMSDWYNHYRFSIDAETEVFNSAQVLYFLTEYLKNSRVPQTLIDRNVRIDYTKLRHLIIIDQKGAPGTNGNFSILQHIIETGSIHSAIETGFSIEELANPGNFISLLYYFGLLTIRGIDDEDTPILAIPNQMIKRLYFDYIDDTYRETGALNMDITTYKSLVRSMAYKGNWEALIKFIAGCMESSLSLRDLMTGEKAHQVFWNVYLGLNSLYKVFSEKEMSQGYSDLVLIPIVEQNPTIKYSYIIELKYIKPADFKKDNHEEKLDVMRREAETQLNRYSMDDKFKKSFGRTSLKKLILIFSGNRLVHHSEI